MIFIIPLSPKFIPISILNSCIVLELAVKMLFLSFVLLVL